MKVLITGANGFLGRALVSQLAALGDAEVLALTRQYISDSVPGVTYLATGEFFSQIQLQSALTGVHTLVHSAARVHIIKDRATNPLAEFRLINVDLTLNLANQAADQGVKRFVFISSVGVNGSETAPMNSFTELDRPCPQTAYALSKWEAEQGLLRIAKCTGIEVVIIRPPLVYGRNAPGNFGSLMCAVKRGWPLPLGAVHNQRSLIALDNLVDFICTCITNPHAANQTFLVSDGHDISTTELLRAMANRAGVPGRLLPVPVWALQLAASFVGKGEVVQRICSNLQVDISKARSLLGWVPPMSVEEGVSRAMS